SLAPSGACRSDAKVSSEGLNRLQSKCRRHRSQFVAQQLYEQGRFLMSDPLYEYFPEYRNAKKAIPRADGGYDIVPVDHPILVKHIFNMTAGLPYNMLLGADAPTQHPTSTAMARAMKRLRDSEF
ncbi:hypothetical protein ACTNE3_12575, partial [Bacillota bacterium HCP3S3_F1_1]